MRTIMRPTTITLELFESEPGVYVAQAVSDDGDQSVVESSESPLRGQRIRDRAPDGRARGAVMSGLTTEALAAMHSGEHDVWGEPREANPVLRAVINVLCEHTEVSCYTVDWRPLMFGAA